MPAPLSPLLRALKTLTRVYAAHHPRVCQNLWVPHHSNTPLHSFVGLRASSLPTVAPAHLTSPCFASPFFAHSIDFITRLFHRITTIGDGRLVKNDGGTKCRVDSGRRVFRRDENILSLDQERIKSLSKSLWGKALKFALKEGKARMNQRGGVVARARRPSDAGKSGISPLGRAPDGKMWDPVSGEWVDRPAWKPAGGDVIYEKKAGGAWDLSGFYAEGGFLTIRGCAKTVALNKDGRPVWRATGGTNGKFLMTAEEAARQNEREKALRAENYLRQQADENAAAAAQMSPRDKEGWKPAKLTVNRGSFFRLPEEELKRTALRARLEEEKVLHREATETKRQERRESLRPTTLKKGQGRASIAGQSALESARAAVRIQKELLKAEKARVRELEEQERESRRASIKKAASEKKASVKASVKAATTAASAASAFAGGEGGDAGDEGASALAQRLKTRSEMRKRNQGKPGRKQRKGVVVRRASQRNMVGDGGGNNEGRPPVATSTQRSRVPAMARQSSWAVQKTDSGGAAAASVATGAANYDADIDVLLGSDDDDYDSGDDDVDDEAIEVSKPNLNSFLSARSFRHSDMQKQEEAHERREAEDADNFELGDEQLRDRRGQSCPPALNIGGMSTDGGKHGGGGVGVSAEFVDEHDQDSRRVSCQPLEQVTPFSDRSIIISATKDIASKLSREHAPSSLRAVALAVGSVGSGGLPTMISPRTGGAGKNNGYSPAEMTRFQDQANLMAAAMAGADEGSGGGGGGGGSLSPKNMQARQRGDPFASGNAKRPGTAGGLSFASHVGSTRAKTYTVGQGVSRRPNTAGGREQTGYRGSRGGRNASAKIGAGGGDSRGGGEGGSMKSVRALKSPGMATMGIMNYEGSEAECRRQSCPPSLDASYAMGGGSGNHGNVRSPGGGRLNHTNGSRNVRGRRVSITGTLNMSKQELSDSHRLRPMTANAAVGGSGDKDFVRKQGRRLRNTNSFRLGGGKKDVVG